MNSYRYHYYIRLCYINGSRLFALDLKKHKYSVEIKGAMKMRFYAVHAHAQMNIMVIA
jgi:hypothetical protein